MGPVAIFFMIFAGAMTEPPEGDTLTPRAWEPKQQIEAPVLSQPTLEAIEPVEEADLSELDPSKLDVDALLEGEMQVTIVKAKSGIQPDVKCIEVDPDRPLECIHNGKDGKPAKRCLLIDGQQKFCKSLPVTK